MKDYTNEFNDVAQTTIEWLKFVIENGHPEHVPFVLQQSLEAAQRVQAWQDMPTITHHSGAILPAPVTETGKGWDKLNKTKDFTP